MCLPTYTHNTVFVYCGATKPCLLQSTSNNRRYKVDIATIIIHWTCLLNKWCCGVKVHGLPHLSRGFESYWGLKVKLGGGCYAFIQCIIYIYIYKFIYNVEYWVFLNSSWFCWLQEGGIVKQKVFLGFWDEERHKDWYTNAGKSRQSKRLGFCLRAHTVIASSPGSEFTI